jgi:hypothetical protein
LAEIASQDAHGTRISPEQARGELEGDRLARPTLANQDFGFTGHDGKRESGEDIGLPETNAHIFKGENPLACGVQGGHRKKAIAANPSRLAQSL